MQNIIDKLQDQFNNMDIDAKKIMLEAMSPKQQVSYVDQLKDPRWKEKRLRIIHRDSHKCQACGISDKHRTLHVHHFKYYRKAWEVKDENLITLCSTCHKREEAFIKANSSVAEIAKETLIPVMVLMDIFREVNRLKPEEVNEFKEYISQFFNKTSIINLCKRKRQFHNGREVVEGGLGGRMKYTDTGEKC